MVKKGLKELEALDDLDVTLNDEESFALADPTPAPAPAPTAGAVSVKYVCIDRGSNTAGPLRRVGGSYLLQNTRFVKLPAGKSAVAHTGIQMQIPKGYQGRVTVLNRLARDLIVVGGGIIDANYTDEIAVVLLNLSSQDRVVKEGNTFAVLTLEKLPEIDLVQVPSLKTSFAQANRQLGMDMDAGFGRVGSGGPGYLSGIMFRKDM